MTKIDKKIVGYSVASDNHPPAKVFTREPVLSGKTYKIEKSAHTESALYVTINDHEGSPAEVFLNCKDMRHYQWTVALTRVISAVFRKGGDCAFLVEELRSIQDPNGGYFRKGKFVPSLVAEIGEVLEQHLFGLGLFTRDDSLAKAALEMVKEKVQSTVLEGKLKCVKCGEFALVQMDGCLTCTACGDSKCS